MKVCKWRGGSLRVPQMHGYAPYKIRTAKNLQGCILGGTFAPPLPHRGVGIRAGDKSYEVGLGHRKL